MKISIITPTFNGAAYLRGALDSILKQSGNSFSLESIVIDGGSTDGTLELLRAIDDPRMRFVSERDSGQAHAINKGLSMAGGDVVAWLNADDLYCPGALQAVARAFAENSEAQWLVGGCDVIDADGNEIRRSARATKRGHCVATATESSCART
jgi:glycosyltransferase involved in cell wall biosynthesis